MKILEKKHQLLYSTITFSPGFGSFGKWAECQKHTVQERTVASATSLFNNLVTSHEWKRRWNQSLWQKRKELYPCRERKRLSASTALTGLCGVWYVTLWCNRMDAAPDTLGSVNYDTPHRRLVPSDRQPLGRPESLPLTSPLGGKSCFVHSWQPERRRCCWWLSYHQIASQKIRDIMKPGGVFAEILL